MAGRDNNKNTGPTGTAAGKRSAKKKSELLRLPDFTLLDSIINTLPLIVIAKDAQSGRIIYWNQAAEETFSLSGSEVIGKRIDNLIQNPTLSEILKKDESDLLSGNNLTYPRLEVDTKEGRRTLNVVKTRVMLDSARPLIISIAQDITRQHDLELDLEKQRQLTQTILDTIDVQIALIDHEGTIVALNKAWEEQVRITGPEKTLLFGTNLLDELCNATSAKKHSHAGEVLDGLKKTISGGQSSFSIEYEYINDNGAFHHLVKIHPLNLDNFGGAVVSQFDITKNKEAELVLRRQHDIIAAKVSQSTADLQLFEKIFHSALEGITVTDTNGTILNVNDAFTRITGYSREEALGKNPRILKSDRHPDEFYTRMWDQLIGEGIWEGEIWNRRKNGEVYPEWLSINSITVPEDGTVNYVAVFHDITQIKEKEEHIERLAYRDALTGLPNRTLLLDRLDMALKRARREMSKVAVLFIDLDNFKNVNDSLGHPVGDQLLCDVAEQMSRQLRSNDTVARIGGDEFVVICPFDNENEVMGLAKRLKDTFQPAFRIKEYSFHVTLSIGIALYPQDGESPDKLIQNADMALYQAKAQGKNSFRLYDQKMNNTLVTRLSLEQELREAVENRTIRVYYQPQINLNTGKIIGFEALARWTRKDGSNVPPNQFIQIAEESGIIKQLGIHVLETACRDMQTLAATGFPGLKISVNLSAVQFRDQHLADEIGSLISRLGFQPENLELEITETIMMNHLDEVETILNQLHQQGIRISVDDFGTGYSSLAYLKRFPISALKIDRSFIRDIIDNDNDKAIVKAILTMSQALNFETIAEGVENEEQERFLRNHDCTMTQGYFYSPALPLDALMGFLSASTRIS